MVGSTIGEFLIVDQDKKEKILMQNFSFFGKNGESVRVGQSKVHEELVDSLTNMGIQVGNHEANNSKTSRGTAGKNSKKQH